MDHLNLDIVNWEAVPNLEADDYDTLPFFPDGYLWLPVAALPWTYAPRPIEDEEFEEDDYEEDCLELLSLTNRISLVPTQDDIERFGVDDLDEGFEGHELLEVPQLHPVAVDEADDDYPDTASDASTDSGPATPIQGPINAPMNEDGRDLDEDVLNLAPPNSKPVVQPFVQNSQEFGNEFYGDTTPTPRAVRFVIPSPTDVVFI